jgi:superfamily I DNA/RNA helicase
MKDTVRTLEAGTETDQIAWFADFDQWQKSVFWDEMRASAKSLSENPAPEVAKLGRKILATLGTAGETMQPNIFVSLMMVASEIRDLVEKQKESTDKKIRGALNLQVNRHRRFLDDLASFIEGLSELNDDEDQDADDDESNQPRVGRAAALAHYMRAVRAQARARARTRSVAKSSRTGRLIEWLGDRSLPEQDLQYLGESLMVQSALRWFVNPVRRYIDGVPARYRRFRRARQAEKRWYRTDGFNAADIHPLEVDILLTTMIRDTDDLIRSARGLSDTDNPARATLERLQRLHRTQVLVDEATDFSPIQLACMAAFARPGTRSFFACGDFNQRVTTWGTRSVEQMKWVVPDIETRAISVAYRQSRQLHALALQIVSVSGGGAAEVVLPDYAENDGWPSTLSDWRRDSFFV